MMSYSETWEYTALISVGKLQKTYIQIQPKVCNENLTTPQQTQTRQEKDKGNFGEGVSTDDVSVAEGSGGNLIAIVSCIFLSGLSWVCCGVVRFSSCRFPS